MRERTRRLRACCAVLAVLAAAAAGDTGPRDTFAGVERTVAVGDVHGDHEQFEKVLRAAGVIDDKCDWAAGKTHLVQVGDVLDRGAESRKAMDLLMKLERQAAAAGGAVHALIGNHEAMVLLGDWYYVHPGEVKAFGGAAEYRKAMGPQGTYGQWIRSHNAAVKVNDVLFVHAGITASCARRSLAAINQAVRRDLARGDADGFAMDPSGPLWDRTLALGDDEQVAAELTVALKRLGAAHMVIGHTVSRRGIVAAAGGRLIRIDVGLAGYYGGPAECLLIEKGAFYRVAHPGGKRRLLLVAPATRPAPHTAPAARTRPVHQRASRPDRDRRLSPRNPGSLAGAAKQAALVHAAPQDRIASPAWVPGPTGLSEYPTPPQQQEQRRCQPLNR